MEERHHVVVPTDVAFQNLACAGVVNVRSVGVFYVRGQVAYARVARILHGHIGTVRWPFLAHNGILEACLFESLLPVVDTLDEVFAPLHGCGGVDIVDDGLLWFDEFAVFPAFQVGLILRFQSPAADEALGVGALLVVAKVCEAVGEVAHARVEEAARHGVIGQADKGYVQAAGHLAHSRCCLAGIGCSGPRLCQAHLGVGGKGADVFDIGEGTEQ